MKNIGLKDTILGKSRLKLGDTYYPLESTVHISHIAQHAVAGERHAFLVSSLQLEVSSYLPVISSAAERSREILLRRSIAKREKSHTDYTDFHRIISPPTNHARKRADCTEPDEKKTKTTAIQSAGWLALASTKCGRKICGNQRNLREIIS